MAARQQRNGIPRPGARLGGDDMMQATVNASTLVTPALRRLNSLALLDSTAVAAINTAAERARVLTPRQELWIEGQPITGSFLLLEGWAARVRQLDDGRRVVMSFILPGDLIGMCDQERPLASSTLVALTRALVCQAPERNISASLDRAYAMSRALDEIHLLSQIARLSRFNAYERITDLLLELMERLQLAGVAAGGRFTFPLTQEIISDAVGLSTVHVNRTLQQARQLNALIWTAQKIQLINPDALRQAIGRNPVRVSAPAP